MYFPPRITKQCNYGYSRNVTDHIPTHLNSALRMCLVIVQAGDAIVTVSKNFDSLTTVFLKHKKRNVIRLARKQRYSYTSSDHHRPPSVTNYLLKFVCVNCVLQLLSERKQNAPTNQTDSVWFWPVRSKNESSLSSFT